MHVPDRTKIDVPIWKMYQPWILVVLFGVLVGFTIFFWFTTDSEEVERRQQSAVELCVREGNSRTECQRRVEQHHDTCYWDWAYTMGGSHRGTTIQESFDLKVYRKCLKMGGEAYTKMRHKKSEKRLQERRERHRKQQQYMP